MANIYKKNNLQKLLLVSFVVLLSQENMQASKEKVPDVYLIHQQANSTCFLSPQYNLMQIDMLLKGFNNNFNEIPKKRWATRRLWLGREYKYIVAWNKAFQSMFTDKYPHLKKFLEDGIENGPVSPHMYKQDGSAIYKEGKAGLFTVAALPHFVSDFNFICKKYTVDKDYVGPDIIPDLHVLAPYFKDYDKKKDIFIYSIYDEEKDIFIKKNYETKSLALQEPMIAQFKIKTPHWNKGIYGAKKILCDYNANCLSYDYQDKKYSFYVIGLYKLMLLRLGLDSDNNIIEKKHKLYPVFKEIRAAFNKKPKKNFWSDTYLKKELFIEYHIANIFKKNKKLFEKAKKVVDFVFEDWKTYTLVQSMTIHKELFKDTDGKKPYDWDILKDYLPGPEQVLAMSMVKNIRMLWYGALSPVAFYEEIGIKENTNLSKYGRPGITWNFAYFKKAAYELVDFDDQKISFINVWHEITESLKEIIKELNQKNFISFDGHGCVLSFHPYLIYLQENVAKTCGQPCDITLLKDLKIAGIESYLSQYLPTFYKKQEGAVLPDFYDMTSKKEDHEEEK